MSEHPDVPPARLRAMGDLIDSLEKAAASIGRLGTYRQHGLLRISSAGVHIDGKPWIGLGHVLNDGVVAPAIVLFLPVLRRYDGEFAVGEALTFGEPAPAMLGTIRDCVLAACEAHGLHGMRFGLMRRHDDGRVAVYVQRDDGRRNFGFVSVDSLDALNKSAEEFAIGAVADGWITEPEPCTTCISFPMLCPFHGQANVARLAAE